MERAVKQGVLSLHAGRRTHPSLVRGRVKIEEHSLRIYCVGNPELAETLMRLPELLLHPACKTIKSEKKIKVVRLPLRIGRTITSVYVKQHNALFFRHRLGSLFCASAALRALSGAATLLQEGYATARPIAAVEYRRRGILVKSFYLAEEIAGARTITNYWREHVLSLKGMERHLKRWTVLRALAGLLKSLHAKGIYHNDLKASNILVRDKGASTDVVFSLIDLQGVKKCFHVSQRRRIKNLAQLNRTLGNYLSRTERLFFIKSYGGDQSYDRNKKRSLIRNILEETSRQIIKEKSRHLITAGASAYGCKNPENS
jgi:tRNA A-37 threonylcarbamoyl transferase component Bud32